MKVEVVKIPKRSKSNVYWLEVVERFLALRDDECLKIAGLDKKQIGSLRQQAYREARARTFTRQEGKQGELIAYLYKGKTAQ